jgi:serine/threonine protein kinase/Ca2+-binding EF-hand superfamily protein
MVFFLDDNPIVAGLIIFSLLLNDIRSWADFLSALSFTTTTWDINERLSRLLLAVVAPVFAWLFWRCVSLSIVWVDRAIICFVILLSARYAWKSAKYNVIGLLRSPVKSARQRAVIDAILEADKPGALFEVSRWEDLYIKDSSESAKRTGGFGTVFLGDSKAKAGNYPVAIKEFKDKPYEDATEIAIYLAQSALAHDLQFTEMLLDKVRATAHRLHQPENVKAEERLVTIEVRALRAVKALASLAKHPGFIELATAHRPSADDASSRFHVVTHRVGPTFSSLIAPASPDGMYSRDARLALLQSAAESLALLHSAGMAHRDVSLGNLAIRLDDPLSAVIIDVGCAFLPVGKDTYDDRLVAKQHMLPPEAHTALRNDAHSLLLMQKRDVWAFGICICALLTGDGVPEEEVTNYMFQGGAELGVNVDPHLQDFLKFGYSCARSKAKRLGALNKQASTAHGFMEEFAEDAMFLATFKSNLFLWCEGASYGLRGATWSSQKAQLLAEKFVSASDPDNLCDLIGKMLHPDPAWRITMAEVATHPLFAGATERAHAAATSASPGTPDADRSKAASRATRHMFAPTRGPALQKWRIGRLLLLAAVVRAAAAATARASGGENKLPSGVSVRSLHAAIDSVCGERAVTLNREQLRRVIEKTGVVSPAALHWGDLFNLFTLLDDTEAGSVGRSEPTVGRSELITGITLLLAPRANEAERLRLTFDAFDKDRNGKLDFDETTNMLQCLTAPVENAADEKELRDKFKALFEELDTDKDKMVSFEELEKGVKDDESLRRLVLEADSVPLLQQLRNPLATARGGGGGGGAAAMPRRGRSPRKG